jgi:predicted HAD superfamily Cof-like phosphohydrolase
MLNRANMTAEEALGIIAASSERRFTDHDDKTDCRVAYPNRPDAWCCPCLAKHALEKRRDWQRDVLAFHKAFDLYIGKNGPLRPSDEAVALRTTLIREEAVELIQAIGNGNLSVIAKEIADLIYVALGTAVSYGIDMGPIFEAVHRSNMAKIGGRKNENGKWIKPEGWTPPDLLAILAAQSRI